MAQVYNGKNMRDPANRKAPHRVDREPKHAVWGKSYPTPIEPKRKA